MEDEYENLEAYNGYAAHDMNVDFDYHMNTGELAEYFDDSDLDNYINNDWD